MNRTAFYYDNRSNLKCVLDPDNGLTYYTYDSLNRMTSVKNPWGEVTQYAYSPGGRLLKRILGNGTIAYYSYDAVGQVSKVQNVKSNLTTISSFEYQRDALGSPISIKREDNSVTYYEYDAKEQLTKETQRNAQGQDVYAWSWDYDPAGNRLHQTFNGVTTAYTCNAANELTQETVGGATTYFSYDHNGNTTAKIEPGATTQYHWDCENLMTQVDLPTGGHNYFAYDADGKRVEKRDGDGYTRFVYQGPNMLKLLQERGANDARQAQYTMGNGLEAMRRGTTSSFYHYDWLGSTFELTNAAQTVTDTYLYDAWGEVLGQTGTTGDPHLYVGRERYYTVPGPGLNLLGLRHYRPECGRFATRDPRRDGDNWYVYVGSAASAKVDPTGQLDPANPDAGPTEVGTTVLRECCVRRSLGAIVRRLRELESTWADYERSAGRHEYAGGAQMTPSRPTNPLTFCASPNRPWVYMPDNYGDTCVRLCAIEHELYHAEQCKALGRAEIERRRATPGGRVENERPAWHQEAECLRFLQATTYWGRTPGDLWYGDCFRYENWANQWQGTR